MNGVPCLLPWVRVLLLIRSITSTTWGHEAWPEVKPVLRRALERCAGRSRARAGGTERPRPSSPRGEPLSPGVPPTWRSRSARWIRGLRLHRQAARPCAAAASARGGDGRPEVSNGDNGKWDAMRRLFEALLILAGAVRAYWWFVP
jgi:hypothetical protein